MFGPKTLAEIREELRSQGIDTERLRQQLTQAFEQPPREDNQSVRKLTELIDILNAQLAVIQSGADTPHSKGST